MPTITRIPVGLNEADNEIMLLLRAKLEARLKKRMTVADIVRMALRTQAKEEGIVISLDGFAQILSD